MPGLSRLALAAAAGAGIIVWAPLADIARGALRDVVSERFAITVAGIVAGAILIALAAGVTRIHAHAHRESSALRPAVRYLLLLLAVVIGVIYARASSTGSPDVDAVERLHFVQYGLLTWLFYRAWLPVGDRTVFIAPVLAGMLVATLDEWCQWLIPYRVGEAHDVFLNGAAIACGLLFSAAIEPVMATGRGFRPGSTRRMWLMAAVAWMAFALFVKDVHVAHDLRTREGDRFLSSLSGSALAAATTDRVQRWEGMTSPVLARRFSVEDRYLTEGLWHVQRRNQARAEGTLADAWSENRILEEFYGAVLDRPISGSPAGSRWSMQERDAVRGAARAGGYVSTANPIPLVAWPPWFVWMMGVGVAGVLAATGIIRG